MTRKSQHIFIIFYLSSFLVLAQSKYLVGYGTTSGTDGGNVFAIDELGNLTKWVDYSNPVSSSSLTLVDDILWGVSPSGGTHNYGAIFQVNQDGSNYKKIIDFDFFYGIDPSGGLLEIDGYLIGTCSGSGEHGYGTIYRISKEDLGFEIIHHFDFDMGARPSRGLVEYDGRLWGVTSGGGNNRLVFSPDKGNGVIYSLSLDGTDFKLEHKFEHNDGVGPEGPLVEASGKLWGVATIGGLSNNGTVFSYDPATESLEVVQAFNEENGDRPFNSLTFSNDLIWGTTYEGGVNNLGVIFQVDPTDNTFQLVKEFSSEGGSLPSQPLIEKDGKLWSTTLRGGDDNFGVLFSINTDGSNYSEHIEGTTENGGLGGSPLSALDGELIMVKPIESYIDDGELFKISTGDLSTTKIPFLDSASHPQNRVTLINDRLYGVLRRGEATIFSMSKDGSDYQAITKLDSEEFGVPNGPLIELNGRLWGTTNSRGLFNDGVLYSLNFDGSDLKVEHDFTQKVNGDLMVSNGVLFGVAEVPPNISNFGLIYKYDPSFGYETVYTFTEIASPRGKLIEYNDRLWGTANSDENGNGVIFSLALDGSDFFVNTTISGTFEDGGEPLTGYLTEYQDALWGLTKRNGAFGNGRIYRYDPVADELSYEYDFSPEDEISNCFGSFTVMDNKLWSISGLLSGSLFSYNPNTMKIENVYPLDSITGNYHGYALTLSVIEKANQEVVFEPIQELSYGDGAVELNASSTSEGTVDFISSDPMIASVLNNQLLIHNAGEVTITAWQEENEEYNRSPDNVQEIFIKKAPLITNLGDYEVEYGDPIPEDLFFTYSGFVHGDSELDLELEPNIQIPTDPSTPVGEYVIFGYEGDDSNYEFLYEESILTIVKKSLTITANDQVKIYGSENLPLTVSYTGFIEGDDENDLNEIPNLSTEVQVTSDVGFYDILVNGGNDDNYEIIRESGIFEVTPTILNVVVEDQTKIYGEPNPTFTLNYTGFINGDDINDLSEVPIASTLANETSSVGSYTIELSGGTGNNYELIKEQGTLTINPAILIVTAENKSKTYGDLNPIFTLSYDGFVNGDDQEALVTKPIVTSAADEFSEVGGYEITVSGGSSGNYDFTYLEGSLIIDPAELRVRADDLAVLRGEDIPILTVSYTGFVNQDDESVIDMRPSASASVSETNVLGSYEITPSGGSDLNYEFIYISGTLTIEDILSIGEYESIEVFPNPAQIGEPLIITTKEFGDISPIIELVDGKGLVIYRDFLFQGQGHIPTLELQSGVYFYRLIADDKEFIGKVILR